MHLLNIKRLGTEIRSYRDPLRDGARPRPASSVSPDRAAAGASSSSAPMLSALDVERVVEEFLRDFRRGGSR
jgi:hypothetical protein